MLYGGDLTPEQCWNLLDSESATTALIDVRTSAEWSLVGMPVTAATMHPVIAQEWQQFPDMAVDPNFAVTLKQKIESLGLGEEANLCFICRSGVRSKSAASAMMASGYGNSFNVTYGFEGDPDENGHRGKKQGWKADSLPWRQH